MSSKPLKILFAIAEAYPFIQVGGLADVGASLPKALARLGHDVRLVLPGYSCVGAGRPIVSLEIPMGPKTERAHVDHLGVHGGVSTYAVGNESYFHREAAYGGYEDDDVAPFVLFSKAVAAFAARSGWKPDVIHCNDWHLGLVPQYVRFGPDRAALGRTRTVFTIHNLAYQGHFGPETEALAGLEAGEGSMLARGITFADAVNTVSRSDLEEILTVKHGMGMDGLLRSRMGDLYGILNGVDYEEFAPETDPYIAARYDGSFVEGKRRNKAVLQTLSGLEPNPDAPLLGMVARLVDQKGVDLLCRSMDEMTALDAQVVIMGRGDEHYERELEEAGSRHAGAVAYHATSEEALARQVYAGSDFFLAPSTFEPCGLGPLIALRYGSIPIARRTGGLAETIRDNTQHPDSGLGFTFARRSPGSLVEAVSRALKTFSRKSEWQALQGRAMGANFSWEDAGRAYERLYARALAGRRTTAVARTKTLPETHVGEQRTMRSKRAVPLALVHHANQYLITDGYDNREGITEIVEGYAAALRLHEEYGIPASLHLSGTLIETLAWHYPWFLELVRDLREKGLISLIGGTYSENVMPLFEPSFNARQLDEFLWLYRRHLRRPPEEVEVCWVPERVWDTEKLAPTLTSSERANGGYRFVLLDDRLLYPTNGSYVGSPRAQFDSIGPFDSNASRSHSYDELAMTETYRTYRIAETSGLVMVPISANLRYWVPPRFPEHWRRLEKTVKSLSRNGGGDTPPVYADDLGKTAGGAWGSAAWSPYREQLVCAQKALREAQREGVDRRLLDLAWKHLLASAYETAWYDPIEDGCVAAPWAKAVASHARACLVMVDAARWFARNERSPSAEVMDIDEDGQDEVILKGEQLYAVITPEHGGRLIYLFSPNPEGGALVVGNPTDDWNFQEELNRYMDHPPNHPGALADVGFEHDRYLVSALSDGTHAWVEMTNA